MPIQEQTKTEQELKTEDIDVADLCGKANRELGSLERTVKTILANKTANSGIVEHAIGGAQDVMKSLDNLKNINEKLASSIQALQSLTKQVQAQLQQRQGLQSVQTLGLGGTDHTTESNNEN
jgi:phosphate starvation-inducible protein PhoH